MLERFMRFVSPEPTSGCWLWTGTTLNGDGYGKFYLSKREPIGAHRAAFMLLVGAVPVGLEICHRCDNRACVNPAHLFAATHRDNIADMNRKGRRADTSGERNPAAKLTRAIVEEIRSRLSVGASGAELGRRFGVSRKLISAIKHRECWA